MTTKQYLGKIDRLYYMIQNKLTEVEQLQIMTYNISSTATDRERVKSSGSQDRMGDSVAKLVDVKMELEQMISDYTDQRISIIGQIEQIENTQYYNILFNRYVANKPLTEIAKDMNYSMPWIKKLHREALDFFEDKYGHMYK